MKLLTTFKHSLDRLLHSRDMHNAFIYISASFVAYGIVFIQNFSLAYILSTEFFGKVTLLISLFSTLYVLFTFGMNAVVQRFHFDKVIGKETQTLLSHIATLWLMFGGVLCIVLIAIGYYALIEYQLLQLDYLQEFLPVLFGAFFFSFAEIFPNLFVVKEQPLRYAGWLIFSRLSIFLLLHLAVFVTGESSIHVAMTLLAAGASVFFPGILIFKIFPISNLNNQHLKEILTYSFPLMVYALGGIGYSHGYRVIISNWLSFEELGIFTITNQIALVYYLAATSCITGLYPKAYKALQQSNGNPASILFYAKVLLLLGVGLIAVIWPAGYYFLELFKGGAFAKGLEILPILLLSQFLFLLYSYNYVLSTFLKRTKIITFSMLAGVITSLTSASLLVENLSLVGAAIPIACGVVVQFTTCFFVVFSAARKASAT